LAVGVVFAWLFALLLASLLASLLAADKQMLTNKCWQIRICFAENVLVDDAPS
jgi:hypothetical protein